MVIFLPGVFNLRIAVLKCVCKDLYGEGRGVCMGRGGSTQPFKSALCTQKDRAPKEFQLVLGFLEFSLFVMASP